MILLTCLMLTATMNPCMCGHLGDTAKACSCTPKLVERYRPRLSGPLLDRIDIHVEVPRLPWRELAGAPEGECSAAIRARAVQHARFEGLPGVHSNAHMGRPSPTGIAGPTPRASGSSRWRCKGSVSRPAPITGC